MYYIKNSKHKTCLIVDDVVQWFGCLSPTSCESNWLQTFIMLLPNVCLIWFLCTQHFILIDDLCFLAEIFSVYAFSLNYIIIQKVSGLYNTKTGYPLSSCPSMSHWFRNGLNQSRLPPYSCHLRINKYKSFNGSHDEQRSDYIENIY